MKKKYIFKNGFTLIELMVVVALIAILAAVVISSLTSARNKGADASVKANLHTAANAAELFYTSNSSSYLPAGGSTFAIATCPVYSASGTNMLSKDSGVSSAVAEAVSRGGNGSSCYNSSSFWAIAVGLKTSASTSWCVDNTGAAKQEAFAPGSAIDGTTFTCK